MDGNIRPGMMQPSQICCGVVVLRAVLTLGLVVLAGPVMAGSADEGRKVANEHCSRCHVVSLDNSAGGIGSTPSFRMLATAFKDWRTRFETFYARRPHPAFLSIEGRGRLREDLPPYAHPVTLSQRAIDDLVALAEEINAQAKATAPKPAR